MSAKQNIVNRIWSVLVDQGWKWGVPGGYATPTRSEVETMLDNLALKEVEESTTSGGIFVEKEWDRTYAIYVQVGQLVDGEYTEVFPLR